MNNLYEEYCDRGAESKLELVDGKLIVGNSLIASRLLLRQILQGWGTSSAISLVNVELWIEALKAAYQISNKYNLNDINNTLNQLEIDIGSIEYIEEDLIAGFRGEENDHNSVRQYLTISLFAVAPKFGGKCFGRDFVMRLGNDGFTPDVIFFTSKEMNTLYSWYLEGPGELVMEVIRQGHEYCDRVIKRDYYAAAGIPEYWVVDSLIRDIEFYRLENGVYKRQFLDNDGRYRPISIPGLAFYPELLWREQSWHYGAFNQDIFEIELEKNEPRTFKAIENNLGWGCLPFSPTIKLQPVSISFEEYICWSPEAKFEFWAGKPQIGGTQGVRNLLGMLLMTFGLTSTVKVLPPRIWLDALKARVKQEQLDSQTI
jgi:Uma2 family endonuclease